VSRILLAAACCLSVATASFTEDPKPVGQRVDHLNIVFSVTNAEQVNTFYGGILGLQRIADLKFPDDVYMIRYMGGKTEIKFIVTGQPLPKMDGGTGKARGLRLMALMLPESKRAGILERMNNAHLPAPIFTKQTNKELGYSYQFGMVFDYDGNQVELVFLDEKAPAEKFDQVQMGCTVSNLAAMDKFVGEIIGATPLVTKERIHRYTVGKSQIKFWENTDPLPAWVGGPMEKIGMNLIQFIVPDVDAVREEVLKRGGKIHTEPFALGALATIMFVEGPDGILFEFAGPLAERFKK
jgi:catechol 2,3-dioxygenase-like lactoylglutathione lyase family enzyme